MKISTNFGDKKIAIEDLTLAQWRLLMAKFFKKNPNSSSAWDLLACVRGPDYPSERPDMNQSESASAYRSRRERKFRTVEIIRHKLFYGVIGGCARSHADTHVTLPKVSQWDHFDRHVQRAANILELPIKTEDS
jgi:hypothetical protein